MSESPKTGPAMVSLAPAGRRPPVPSWVVALLAGLCLILAAAAIAADRVAFAAPPDHPLVWAAGSALVLIGVATVGAGLSGRRAGGLVGLAVVALLAALAVGPTRPTLSGALDTDTWGNRQWQPAGPVLADHTFRTRLGAGTIDLSDIGPLRDGAQPATITVQAELAEVQVRVPSDLTVAIDLTARGGDIGYVTTDGGTVRESTLDATIGPEGPADLRLVGNLDLASLSIVTVPR